MNNIPREMLARIVAKYGTNVGGDARRCESLLNDLCGEYRREINVLVNAVDERIPLDLMTGASSTPLELLLTRLEKRFENQTGLTPEAARWAVESWALALGTATSAEIAERERELAAQTPPKTETIKPFEPENEPPPPNIPNVNRPKPPAPPKIQTPPPKAQTPLPPKPAPPVSRQPHINPFPPQPAPAPPVRLPANRQPQAQNQAQNQPIQPAQSAQPTAAPKRGFGIFRGCFLLIVFLIVAAAALVFVAPFALETMRETQRERQNEPPRFPAR